MSFLPPVYSGTILFVVLTTTWWYLRQLSIRLTGPHPHTGAAKPDLSPEALDKVSYGNINMLNGIPRQKTGKGYAVVGGGGFLGEFIVRLLLLRGETYIRILDIQLPRATDLIENPSVTFVKTDITEISSIHAALTQPFPNTNKKVEVIYHTAAAIRFWDRLGYTWPATYRVNVLGTRNVVEVAKQLQSEAGTKANISLIYTSSIDAAQASVKFSRLSWGPKVLLRDPSDLITPETSDRCYQRSKLEAEAIVKSADCAAGKGTIRAGIVRPGCALMGPNDFVTTRVLNTPVLPTFDDNWSATNVCVWDVAAGHLLLEEALQKKHAEVGGKYFLVTGDELPWSCENVRKVLIYFSKRPIKTAPVSILAIFIFAHLIEAFLFLRYHFLLPIYFVLFGGKKKPSLSPKWLGSAVYLQPAMLKYLQDVIVDDSRARKVLGYKPQWETLQYLKWAVDETLKRSDASTQDRSWL
ncbi:NAD(P)-binding protein [Pluteus cervinus]|uniref:NAD(P)-binding protein n=1 Tax=Pluteus cervinus TaxID=181527 RepID=A0ACD3AP86_9AGAR|nr:NAD(P)-binding protein [Pluteus cervinus]